MDEYPKCPVRDKTNTEESPWKDKNDDERLIAMWNRHVTWYRATARAANFFFPKSSDRVII